MKRKWNVYTAIPCPHCKAHAGSECQTPKGHRAGWTHKARIKAYRKLEGRDAG